MYNIVAKEPNFIAMNVLFNALSLWKLGYGCSDVQAENVVQTLAIYHLVLVMVNLDNMRSFRCYFFWKCTNRGSWHTAARHALCTTGFRH